MQNSKFKIQNDFEDGENYERLGSVRNLEKVGRILKLTKLFKLTKLPNLPQTPISPIRPIKKNPSAIRYCARVLVNFESCILNLALKKSYG